MPDPLMDTLDEIDRKFTQHTNTDYELNNKKYCL